MDWYEIVFLLLLCLAIAGGVWYVSWRRKRRRTWLMQHQITPSQVKILHRLPLYRRLPHQLRRELRGRLAIFLDEKVFEGCGGLKVTEEMQVMIGAMGCLLLLGKELDDYPDLDSILIYPNAYVVPVKPALFNNEVHLRAESVRLGESWLHGSLVLAWSQVRSECLNPHTRSNVALHEFAHQLDQLNGPADGIPPLPDGKTIFLEWRTLMKAEYDRLVAEARHAVPDVLDWYGATNAAEFFAVTTESFFCSPIRLKEVHPNLYELFREFYRVDPAGFAAV